MDHNQRKKNSNSGSLRAGRRCEAQKSEESRRSWQCLDTLPWRRSRRQGQQGQRGEKGMRGGKRQRQGGTCKQGMCAQATGKPVAGQHPAWACLTTLHTFLGICGTADIFCPQPRQWP